jgi:hypothetical protein
LFYCTLPYYQNIRSVSRAILPLKALLFLIDASMAL